MSFTRTLTRPSPKHLTSLVPIGESPLGRDPAEVLDFALSRLQEVGVKLTEWRALLYRRMKVPLMVKDYSYLVPDDQVALASSTLADLGLPLMAPTKFNLNVYGDFEARGRRHLITRDTSGFSAQHIMLYPHSFSTLSEAELEIAPPSHHISPRSPIIRVPSVTSVYASLIRMLHNCPPLGSTWTILQCELSELVGYHLLDLCDGFVDPGDEQEWKNKKVDEKIPSAVDIVQSWGENGRWKDGEGWIAEALVELVRTGDLPPLPRTP
ncbi:hypothetical protein BXZ70DRAFT_941002 [Cristinia sonorae]|uniref:Uncharacterized protein n=1 Tax=Cristinia sonorae TaxID=1940300 RepID=A0A8K0UM39_9AGAR|nr:hypothetical protein BXZ70DRAFT_941002 [Cristinia sonorae]